MKLFDATAIDGEGEPGVVLGVSHARLQVGAGDGVLAVAELQIEGRRRMAIDEFLRGTHVEPGMVLGQEVDGHPRHGR